MLTHVDIKITFTKLLNKLLTSRPTAWSISGAWAGVSHVTRSAVAMTAHCVTYCVVVPNIRFTLYFTVQNGADQEDHLLTYMHADNISLHNKLWVNRCSLELLLILKDSFIIGLINQALIIKTSAKTSFFLWIQAVANTPVSVTHRAAAGACRPMSVQKQYE